MEQDAERALEAVKRWRVAAGLQHRVDHMHICDRDRCRLRRELYRTLEGFTLVGCLDSGQVHVCSVHNRSAENIRALADEFGAQVHGELVLSRDSVRQVLRRYEIRRGRLAFLAFCPHVDHRGGSAVCVLSGVELEHSTLYENGLTYYEMQEMRRRDPDAPAAARGGRRCKTTTIAHVGAPRGGDRYVTTETRHESARKYSDSKQKGSSKMPLQWTMMFTPAEEPLVHVAFGYLPPSCNSGGGGDIVTAVTEHEKWRKRIQSDGGRSSSVANQQQQQQRVPTMSELRMMCTGASRRGSNSGTRRRKNRFQRLHIGGNDDGDDDNNGNSILRPPCTDVGPVRKKAKKTTTTNADEVELATMPEQSLATTPPEGTEEMQLAMTVLSDSHRYQMVVHFLLMHVTQQWCGGGGGGGREITGDRLLDAFAAGARDDDNEFRQAMLGFVNEAIVVARELRVHYWYRLRRELHARECMQLVIAHLTRLLAYPAACLEEMIGVCDSILGPLGAETRFRLTNRRVNAAHHEGIAAVARYCQATLPQRPNALRADDIYRSSLRSHCLLRPYDEQAYAMRYRHYLVIACHLWALTHFGMHSSFLDAPPPRNRVRHFARRHMLGVLYSMRRPEYVFRRSDTGENIVFWTGADQFLVRQLPEKGDLAEFVLDQSSSFVQGAATATTTTTEATVTTTTASTVHRPSAHDVTEGLNLLNRGVQMALARNANIVHLCALHIHDRVCNHLSSSSP